MGRGLLIGRRAVVRNTKGGGGEQGICTDESCHDIEGTKQDAAEGR